MNTAQISKKSVTIDELNTAVELISQAASQDFLRKVDEQVEDNEISLIVIPQTKYSKLVYDDAQNYNPVFGFIVMNDSREFKKGDLLRAINANEPDLTESVGNIYDLENADISWTGL